MAQSGSAYASLNSLRQAWVPKVGDIAASQAPGEPNRWPEIAKRFIMRIGIEDDVIAPKVQIGYGRLVCSSGCFPAPNPGSDQLASLM